MRQYQYLKRVEVPVEQLKIGMYVGELDKPWRESSFLLQGFPIETQEQIAALQRECRSVYVDFRTQQDYDIYLLQAGDEVELPAVIPPSEKRLVEELPVARDIFLHTHRVLNHLMAQAYHEEAISLVELNRCVIEILDSLNRQPNALLLASNIRNKTHYTCEHQIRVCIYALAFGMALGMSAQQLQTFGLGALLFDIGKSRVSPQVLEKPQKIDRQEALLLKEHPRLSFDILSRIEGVSETIREMALSHHERVDGRGYPRHIPPDRVSRYAKIISILDAYDAMLSDRPYSKARNPSQVIKQLRDNQGSKFDPNLTESFLAWLSPTPVGSLVELQTGEVGLVLSIAKARKQLPLIMLITDEAKQGGVEKLVNLADGAVHPSFGLYQVRELLDEEAYGLNRSLCLRRVLFESSQWGGLNTRLRHSPFAKYF